MEKFIKQSITALVLATMKEIYALVIFHFVFALNFNWLLRSVEIKPGIKFIKAP